ncbi:hypothetical protein [Streptosporangium canum]|uniref:hypothetical protein n=1 Tax=Streptosporangium canum TaxID=324952 RepID=UPI003F4E211C
MGHRPTPPGGYVALGDIFTGGSGGWVTPASSKAPWDNFRCVRADYAHTGSYGQILWNTDGTGLGRVWPIVTVRGVAVAANLSADRRRASAEGGGDRPD